MNKEQLFLEIDEIYSEWHGGDLHIGKERENRIKEVIQQAINYTHSSSFTELKGGKAISFEVYQDTFYGKLYNGKYQSKLDKNKIVTHNDIVKEYEGDTIN